MNSALLGGAFRKALKDAYMKSDFDVDLCFGNNCKHHSETEEGRARFRELRARFEEMRKKAN